MSSLKLKVYKGMRDDIYKTNLQKEYGMLPPGLTTMVAPTGSGKTNVICNILDNFLKDYYDEIYLFCLSPCDMLKPFIDKDKVYMDDDPTHLERILAEQDKTIAEKGYDRAKHVLIILDDIVQSNTFLKHQILNKVAYSGTWSKISCIITTQNYNHIPRRLRLNIHSILLFHGITDSEIQRFCEEHASAYMSKKDFVGMVKYALSNQYDFLFYNRTNPNKREAYRRNFEEILRINGGKEKDI